MHGLLSFLNVLVVGLWREGATGGQLQFAVTKLDEDVVANYLTIHFLVHVLNGCVFSSPGSKKCADEVAVVGAMTDQDDGVFTVGSTQYTMNSGALIPEANVYGSLVPE